jgi:hypothetical protein
LHLIKESKNVFLSIIIILNHSYLYLSGVL